MTKAWLMVAVAFVTNFCGIGFVYFAFGVFLVPLTEEFESGRLGVSMIPLAMGVGGALMSPFLGRWVGRGSIRTIMFTGCVAAGVGFLASAHATELWQLVAVYGTLLTFSYHSLGGFASQAMIVNWFHDNPARALGFALLGTSLSGIVVPPLATWLIESGSWRDACEVFGWISLGIAPVIWWLVIGHPPQSNSEDTVDVLRTAHSAPPITTREALRLRTFWFIAVASGSAFMGGIAITTHIVPYAIDLNFSATQAAWVLSAMSGGSALGKLGVGWVVARLGERLTYQISLLIEATVTLVLLIDMPLPMLALVAAVIGLGMGCNDALLAALVTKVFGRNSFGPVLGLIMASTLVVGMSGAPIAAWIYDTMGSYDFAWLGFSLTLLIGAVLAGRVRSVHR